MSEEIKLTIRQATAADSQALTIFLKEEEANLSDLAFVEDFDPQDLSQSLDNLYDSTNNLLLLAFEGLQVVGLVSIAGRKPPMLSHIGELGIYISPDFRNMGLGKILLEEAIYWVENESNLSRIELQVQARNTKAIALYEKFSFKKEGTLIQGAQVAGKFYDTLLMAYLPD